MPMMAKFNVRNPRVWIPGLVVLLLVGLVVLRVIQARADRPEQQTVEQIRAARGVPVSVATVVREPLDAWRQYSGTVSGASEAVVRARTGDQIADVAVTVGDRVRAGQVLVRQAGEGTQARVRQATAAMNQARRTVDRLRPLHEAGAISDQEWEQVLTQLELASADLAAARDVLLLTSPLAGTVTEVVARPGMIPSAGDPLVRVADLSRLVVYLRISASEAAEIQEGQPARLADSGANNGDVGVATGRVQRVALQADPATRMVEVEVAFPPTPGLIPGTLATVYVGIATRDQAVQVPRAAVRGGTVWVVDEAGRARLRSVRTGLEGNAMIEIMAGLDPGDQVVVEGGALLSEGALVRIINGGGGASDDV
jgi:membrane fusion protein, multidrug efflux system